MTLRLYMHPLSSYCWKTLIALYETGVPFEQEIVDQYALAMAAAGLTDAHVAATRRVVFEFAESM